MSRFRLKTQFLLLTGLILAGFALFGLQTYLGIEKVKVGGPLYQRIVLDKDLVADILPPPNYIIESFLTVQLLADPDHATQRAALVAKLQALKRDYDLRHDFWLKQDLPEPMRTRLLSDAHEAAAKFFSLAEQAYVPAVLANDTAQVREILGKLEAHYEVHRKAIDEVVVMATSHQQEVENQTAAALSGALIVMLAVLALTVAAALVGTWLLSASVIGGISRARGQLANIAAGDFSHRTEHRRADEVGELLSATDDTSRALREVILAMRSNADSLASAADRVAATTSTLAANSGRQSASVSSIAATVQEMSTGISHIATLADGSEQRAQDSGTQCRNGSSEIDSASQVVGELASGVGQSANAVQALGARSQEISSIVGVIREIADQTNLLALNAAIEAARAGEQGRGFAVVADEVRKLAERTAKSTDQIARVIDAIGKGIDAAVAMMASGLERAQQSTEAVNRSRATMRDIACNTQLLLDDLRDVALGLRAQKSGGESVAGEVEGIARATEENSAGSQQLAEAAAALAALAKAQQQSAARFRC